MSTKLQGYVWDGCADSGMKTTKVAIMARIADFASDEGIAWPSVETIARQVGAGISTVRGIIAELAEDGWLSREQRRKGNRNTSNLYQLNVDKLKEAADCALSKLAEKKKLKLSHPPESERSESDRSESSKNGSFDHPESGGDPSVKISDPSSNRSMSENSDESSDSSENDFLSSHPEAEIYTPSGKMWGTADDLKAARWIHDKIASLGTNPKEPSWPAWANEIRLMREKDKRTHREICELYGWVNRDPFWRMNVLSPAKLRTKWDELVIKSRYGAFVKPREELDWDNTDWADSLPGGLI
ncbi:helix-turn-helix domain-containing protein [Budvicia aquatica]|uniref:helix-turn-helix domain-containing protein n=1 Tax=Budvicia aquatica TaxID=82979 RepID=UPI00208330BE|nr:helix-turn-helix domain-containing protein [Budvicia aquatica]GKX50583.1 replication protein [Budvicia aquatica]